jgi:hypothetical protein
VRSVLRYIHNNTTKELSPCAAAGGTRRRRIAGERLAARGRSHKDDPRVCRRIEQIDRLAR